MFNSYSFSYNSIPCEDYDLMIYDIGEDKNEVASFGTKANIIEKRILRKIQPIHFGVNLHEEPLEFKLIFGAFHPLDRFEFEAISLWLVQPDYCWLDIVENDLNHVRYRCLIRELTPIAVDWLPYSFQADIICDCPYSYSYPFSQSFNVNGSMTTTFYNESTMNEYFKPELTIVPRSSTIEVVNVTDNNRSTKFTGVPTANCTIYMDNNNGILTDKSGGVNLFPFFNMNFFRLLQGNNQLKFTGNGTYTISGMFLHNTGA